jgi:hypothetical protein
MRVCVLMSCHRVNNGSFVRSSVVPFERAALLHPGSAQSEEATTSGVAHVSLLPASLSLHGHAPHSLLRTITSCIDRNM